MDVICSPGLLRGVAPAIPSKSDAHRIFICAALADRPTRVVMDPRLSQDTAATRDCLVALGAAFTPREDGFVITPIAAGGALPSPTLDCGESGSTLRFLLPVAAALGCGATFTGAGRLPQRPIGPILDALAAGGVTADRDSLPLTLDGRLSPGRYTLPGNVSSQFITGLLLALPLVGGGEILLEQPLESAPYVEMTRRTLAQFGVEAAGTDRGFLVPPGAGYRSPGTAAVEGDWSNMAFFLTAGALGGPVACTGLAEASAQGDRAIVPLLSRLGAAIHWEKGRVSASGGRLEAIQIDAREIPDLVPILAVAAAYAQGETLIHGAARLRLKESDRIQSVVQMLRSLGGQAEEGPDFLRIRGQGGLEGGVVDCCGDHRIAMAAAIAATACRGDTRLVNAQAAYKSYPRFFEDYQLLGGTCHVVYPGGTSAH